LLLGHLHLVGSDGQQPTVDEQQVPIVKLSGHEIKPGSQV